MSIAFGYLRLAFLADLTQMSRSQKKAERADLRKAMRRLP